MRNLHIVAYDIDDNVFRDFGNTLQRRQGLEFTTIYPGGLYGSCSFFVPQGRKPGYLLNRAHRIKIFADADFVVWEGFVDDIADMIQQGTIGVDFVCSGHWGGLLGRRTINRRWHDTRVA
ncbi:MAG: hypothetical protein MJA29_14190, partial [Candidatus Omnitrophica bacterium]|nr:hypothetical protein [Candidatus Omnitrophota bacterium]